MKDWRRREKSQPVECRREISWLLLDLMDITTLLLPRCVAWLPRYRWSLLVAKRFHSLYPGTEMRNYWQVTDPTVSSTKLDRKSTQLSCHNALVRRLGALNGWQIGSLWVPPMLVRSTCKFRLIQMGPLGQETSQKIYRRLRSCPYDMLFGGWHSRIGRPHKNSKTVGHQKRQLLCLS